MSRDALKNGELGLGVLKSEVKKKKKKNPMAAIDSKCACMTTFIPRGRVGRAALELIRGSTALALEAEPEAVILIVRDDLGRTLRVRVGVPNGSDAFRR